jgi:chromosome segregation ATPase|tara:strand:- start:210 stop:515 length:306 start_codon:yes stop_codon:yes gene_type:complete
MIQAEDKTYENEATSQEYQLKNIIDMKEAEIATYQQRQMALYNEIKRLKVLDEEHQKLNGRLRLEISKLKEDDKLMIDKITKYEKEIKKLKKEAKDMLQYP